MSKIIEDVKNCVEPIIQSLNMELVDVEFKKQYGQDTLTIFIDKDGGVDLDACELVHNAIDAPLDELDPTSGKAYTLNVSSPGLDRPIKTERDFEKKMNSDVEVSLYKPLENKLKKFEGKLVGYDKETCSIEYKNKILKINLKDIAGIRSAIKF